MDKTSQYVSMYKKTKKKENLGHWQRHLLQQAEGMVLELAVGVGANFAYYSPNVQVTAVDISL